MLAFTTSLSDRPAPCRTASRFCNEHEKRERSNSVHFCLVETHLDHLPRAISDLTVSYHLTSILSMCGPTEPWTICPSFVIATDPLV